MGPFGGWLMPIQYSGIIAEHNWTRQNASLFDICHMGEFIVFGNPDKANLNKIVTFNLNNMAEGSCRYCFMLNEEGGIIDDLVVYRIANEQWMFVVNAATTDSDEAHIKKYLSKNAKLENVSAKLGKLDLQGPLSEDILAKIISPEIKRLKYYAFGFFKILDEENIISRTGYTGEIGYELYISSQRVEELWRTLLNDEMVKPAGLGARDTLRLEMGYSLYGQDIDDDITPIEAGLEQFVDYTKDFIGKGALLNMKKQGVSKRLIYFITDSRRSVRHGHKIYSGSRDIGVVTSGSFAPSLSCSIGMGYVDNGYDNVGADISIKAADTEIKAAITYKPFYKKGSARI